MEQSYETATEYFFYLIGSQVVFVSSPLTYEIPKICWIFNTKVIWTRKHESKSLSEFLSTYLPTFNLHLGPIYPGILLL